ncbi:Major facilitator superfamily domain, general substrate transporter [Cordyceps fumosorosea ARSEF 2679]|uniref:Major facilitator superfamily domain, general substrate transporter n=1 Tax=Cordyceps fumosorosea (strain ARSEF 2679) TaxID=1081104 RepID=A0A167NLP8_CORFA|nr:Major facilitator superfamily domain, general substrate transporter [Cordyceps fumosorosea ARSEF 2679]OAA55693.1 Major facilitator superfamily domain, general substrate transporter [Cordyceps fumosorosea ARSEF 2679]
MDSSIEEPLLASNAHNQEPGNEQNGRINTRALVLLFLNVLVVDIGYIINLAPMTRIFEDITCRQYLHASGAAFLSEGGRPDESRCKIPEVQGPVAELFGYQTFFDSLVGIILGLHFGALADRIGRRPIYVLGLGGSFLASCWKLYVCWMGFPLRYVWLSSAFLILGGGDTVLNACLTMIITDATPAALRSRVALYFAASNLGSEVIAPPIASYFIDSNPWIPVVIGVCCNGLAVLLASCLPETLPPKTKQTETINDAHDAPGEDRLEPIDGTAKDGSFKSTIKHMLQLLQYIRGQRALLLLVCVFAVSDFARRSMQFLVQYASVRYRMTLGQANYLLAWRAMVAIALHMTIMPATDKFVQSKLRMPPRKKDLTLARISICLYTAGFVALAFAPTVVTVIFGYRAQPQGFVGVM